MFEIYIPLILAVLILLFGMICYHLLKYEINEDSKLYKYRPKSNNILIRLKLFKYNWKFNYFLLVPHLISWAIFLTVVVFYTVYWLGGGWLKSIFLLRWVQILIFCLLLLLYIYCAIIQQVINRYNDKAKKSNKDEEKLIKGIIKDAIKNPKK